jgi:hypothetical protein
MRPQKVVICADGQGRPYSEVTSINSNASRSSLMLDSQLAPETTSDEELRPELAGLGVSDVVSSCQIRRTVYNRPVGEAKMRSKVQNSNSLEELEPEMDDVVNAGSRDWRCYRAPSMIYFGNDSIGRSSLALTLLSFGSLYITPLQVADSAQCQAGGCARCGPPPVDAVCCSLCHPDKFLNISFVEAPSRSHRNQTAPPPTAQRLDKKYVPSPADMDLQTALHTFCTPEEPWTWNNHVK